MNKKRWLWHLLRALLTGAAIWIVVQFVRFDDYVRIREAGGDRMADRSEVREIERREDGRTVVHWKEGPPSEHAAEDVTEYDGFLTLFERADKGLFFAMLAAALVPITVLGIRWWLLLRGNGLAAPFAPVFLMNYAGIFFNNFLPGGVGGDLTRAFLASSGEERKAAVVGTILLDRVIGLVAMILMGAVCVTPVIGRFEDKTVVVFLYGLVGGMVVAYLVYFNPVLRRKIGDRLPFRKTLAELDGVFRSIRERKPLAVAALGLSFLAQGSMILVVYGMARALGIDTAPLWAFFVFEPIIFILTAIPISVGGWGVQEGAYVALFATVAGLMEPNQAIALSILFKLGLIAVSIPGGVLFAMGFARRTPAP